VSAAEDRLVAAVAASGLTAPGGSGLVMLSGGADSCALTLGLAAVCDPDRMLALHLNYGLRAESGQDEAAARAVCERLGIELCVVPAGREPGITGNLHAWARERRYGEAESLRSKHGLDWIAVAHTRSDLAETLLYRLATSPGTRALAAMPARRGRVVRPLLSLSRAEVREAAESAGLPFVDDRSNDDPAFARARIRNEVLPVLADLNPSVLESIALTRAELGEELDFIDSVAAGMIEADATIPAASLQAAHPALRRHALRLLAERALERPVALGRGQAARICRLVAEPEGGSIDIGDSAFLVAESGVVTVVVMSGQAPEPTTVAVPGQGSWDGWRILAEPMEAPFRPEGPEIATLDADRLGERVVVRCWRDGDRIGPLGMTGTKSLQDLFTDAGVRRSLRGRIPVFEAAGEVAWVPGLAVADRFRLRADTRRAVRISAREDRPADGGAPGASLRSA
jgi:tRNA(Ile)-lysidine synthase